MNHSRTLVHPVEVSVAGFEPAFSTIPGWRALQAAPHAEEAIALADNRGSWNRTNTNQFKRLGCRLYTIPPSSDAVGPVGVEPTPSRLKDACAAITPQPRPAAPGNPKSQVRNPKRSQHANHKLGRGFGRFRFRLSDFFRISDFEFRISRAAGMWAGRRSNPRLRFFRPPLKPSQLPALARIAHPYIWIDPPGHGWFTKIP